MIWDLFLLFILLYFFFDLFEIVYKSWLHRLCSRKTARKSGKCRGGVGFQEGGEGAENEAVAKLFEGLLYSKGVCFVFLLWFLKSIFTFCVYFHSMYKVTQFVREELNIVALIWCSSYLAKPFSSLIQLSSFLLHEQSFCCFTYYLLLHRCWKQYALIVQLRC